MACTNVRDEEVALRQIAREFTDLFNRGDGDPIMRFYSDFYVDVNLWNPVQTHEERRRYYRHVMLPGIRVGVQSEDIRLEGQVALVRATIYVTPPGGCQATESRYLAVALKQADGSWQVIWGMDGPVQEYDPSACRRGTKIGVNIHHIRFARNMLESNGGRSNAYV